MPLHHGTTGPLAAGNRPPADPTADDGLSLRDTPLADDREAIRNIVTRTGFFRPEEIEVAVELVDERLARGAPSGYEFVFAETGGAVVGYACYGAIACTVSSYDLYWIAVDPSAQRRGLGGTLMAAVAEGVRRAGGTRIYIDTSGLVKYAPTRAFYERSGFVVDARLKDFYAPGDDRVVYRKIIDPLPAGES